MPDPKPCSSLKEYLQLEFKEMLEGDNPWFVGIKLDRPPTRDECAEHYTSHHGDDDFRTRYYVVTVVTVDSQPPASPEPK